MVTQYKVVSVAAPRGFLGLKFDEAAEKLTEEVNREISVGWEPQGGVTVAALPQSVRCRLLQAMVRRR